MIRKLIVAAVVSITGFSTAPSAEAGPLLDWLLGRNRCRPFSSCWNRPAPYYPTAGTCQTTCTQTCQRVVVNYVPYTAYRTDWEQVPVTQYQQTSSTDPCTGCTVTCMRPCTSYTWQMKRVPYVTYRPVYRTESYSVPITYSTPACGTCGVGVPGCATCGVPANVAPAVSQMPVTYGQSYTSVLDPNATYSSAPGGSTSIYGSPAVIDNSGSTSDSAVPADQVPSLKPIILDRREITPDSSSYQFQRSQPSSNVGLQGIRPIQDPNPESRWDHQPPAQQPVTEDQTASAPTRQRWEYNPIQLASYREVQSNSTEPREIIGSTVIRDAAPTTRVNVQWKTSQW